MKIMTGSRKWLAFFGLFAVVFLFAPRFVQIYVDSLWFNSLGYSSVFWYSLRVKWELFFGFFGLTLALLQGSLWLLQRAFAPYNLGGMRIRIDTFDIDLASERFLKPVGWGLSVLWAFGQGVAMASQWPLFALYLYGKAGATTDPIFHKPLGFFLFRWPVQSMLASWLFSMAVLVLLATLLYVFFVAIAPMPEILKREARRTATVAYSAALAPVLCIYAWHFSLARFSQIWKNDEIFTGIGYTQAHILIPGFMLVALTLLGTATVNIANAVRWQRPLLSLYVLAVPLTTYIKHNIEGTRRAFKLDSIESRDFSTKPGVAAFRLNEEKNRTALENIRLWDWQALQATLRQVQVLRTYYDFPDVDVDRYVIKGQKRQVMIAARELDIDRLPAASRNWVNDRLVYTHGYGVTINTANGFTAEGRPHFLLSDVPVKSTIPEIKLTRPEIYFGQKTDNPVYVKTKQKEFDFPQGDTNAYTTYQGTGGVELGGPVRRLLLAWALGDLSKIPFSSDITPQSRVLLHRNILERAQRIAPFLQYDDDPYIVVGKNGRLYWMIDAYTSSSYYPYSRHYPVAGQWANYMRNSVKVVIDAYNGTTDFYAFDAKDPIINSYRAIFPELFKDVRAMPRDLREHVRYPEQMFRTQAEVYGLYHMQDVRLFFGREDVWSVAGEGSDIPDGGSGPGQMRTRPDGDSSAQPLDPYFVLMPLPGEDAQTEFVQILPFTPSRRRNMIGWIAGRSDGNAYGSLLAYDFPKSQLVDGPAQIKARINQDPFLSGQFTLWNQHGSTILRGNMLVIPLGGALLYVEPIFLQANQSPTPELRLVVLATQEHIVYGTNFQEALGKLLGENGGPASTSALSSSTTSQRQSLINRAANDLEAYQRLTSQGRYSEAGKRLERVRRALEQLRQ
jgi:uncharacterized membrane protein (UPF0182 family)